VTDEKFTIKNALEEDRPAKAEVNSLQQSLDKVNMALVKDEAHSRWMKVLAGLKESSEKMDSSGNLEEARKHFSMLSHHILDMTESFGLDREVVYRDYCPMAFGDQGAFWLSEKKEILNPYFGSSMLSCGEIKQTYLKGQPVLNLQSQTPSAAAPHRH